MRACLKIAVVAFWLAAAPVAAQDQSREPPMAGAVGTPAAVTADIVSLAQGAANPLDSVGGENKRPVLYPCPNCGNPGIAPNYFGTFTFSGPAGNTGTSNYLWYINDPGPSATFPTAPGIAGGTSLTPGSLDFGWSLAVTYKPGPAKGNFNFDASPTDKLTFILQTLTGASTVGNEILGPMQNFDSTLPYSWLIVSFVGTYASASGDLTNAQLNASTTFDLTTGPFANSIPPGSTFGWNLVVNSPAGTGGSLSLVYTPVPELGTLALVGIGALTVLRGAIRRRRRLAASGSWIDANPF